VTLWSLSVITEVQSYHLYSSAGSRGLGFWKDAEALWNYSYIMNTRLILGSPNSVVKIIFA